MAGEIGEERGLGVRMERVVVEARPPAHFPDWIWRVIASSQRGIEPFLRKEGRCPDHIPDISHLQRRAIIRAITSHGHNHASLCRTGTVHGQKAAGHRTCSLTPERHIY